LSALGIALVMAERVTEALSPLERAALSDPIPGDTLLYLGMAYRALGMTEKARDAYARHIEQLGDDRDRLHFCHVTLHALGEFDLAARCRPPRREGRPLFLTWWTRAVGHIAYLDSWVKSRLLAGEPLGDPIIRTTTEATANRFYLSCWSRWFRIEETQNPSAKPDEEETYFPSPLTLANRAAIPFYEAFGAIQQEWERQGRAPLLTLPEEVRRNGRERLARLGVEPGRWFVTLHVREGGFKQYDVGFGHRNAALDSYIPAVEEIMRRGGVVVRLGAPHMRSAPKIAGLIDYARSELRSDWMDVFLCAEGLFHIGVESGISHVPITFGRPTLFTNWVRLGSLPSFGADRVMPKLLRSEHDGRILPLAEILASGLGHMQYSFFPAARGLRLIVNTAEEIRDAALEMLDHVHGIPTDDEPMQEAIRTLFLAHGQTVNCRFPRAFLCRHFAELMPDAAPLPDPP
jgi:putative glycosyltransferase (TIGR04372 family)